MCGIAGYFGKLNVAPERLSACRMLMRRRGPDDEGEFIQTDNNGTNLYLLQSRLSIIDVDPRARQPFLHRGDALCYNGEIYNYIELRGELLKSGSTFFTDSDTEVLAQLLKQDGMLGIASCEGMWAFAWFDSSNKTLHLCRDRFGEKPLYFFEDKTGVYFGSEPKFIFALLGHKLPVNQAQLQRYLVNGYKTLYKRQETFFEGLFEISPGSYKSFGNNSGLDTHYWQPVFDAEDNSISYRSAVEAAREALIRSVELRLRSDVPIAFCLSGGVDSNALVSIAKKHFGYDVHGFTIINTDSRYEERDMVDLAVRDLDLRHTKVPITTDNFLSNLRTLIRYHDAPVYTISYYAHWQLMQEIHAQGYKVSVSGTGADELFSGYFDHHNAYLADIKNTDEMRYRQALSEWQETVLPIVRNPFLQDPEYLVNTPHGRSHIFLDSDIFGEMLCVPFREPFEEGTYAKKLLRNRMANELRHEAVPVILHEDDLNAMYYSVENRSPFLDTALFQVCQSIPTRHLIREGKAKAVLRDAVRGLATEAVIDNPRKIGFNVPIFEYLDVRNPMVKDELLSDSLIYDIVSKDAIESLLSLGELPNSRSKFLFNFICAKIFLEEYS